jgi:NDP-sugar pyrophosphorylase family protein
MASMQEEKDNDISLDTIAPSKLLNYVTKDNLIAFVTPQRYAELEHRLREMLNKSKINLKDIKKHLATQPQFIQSLKRHETGVEAFQKYQNAVARLQDYKASIEAEH